MRKIEEFALAALEEIAVEVRKAHPMLKVVRLVVAYLGAEQARDGVA